MDVSILTLNLSHNCLTRAHMLGRLLERNHDVEIVGPELGDGVWEPLRGKFDYQRLNTNGRVYEFPLSVWHEQSEITGDVVYAVKTRMTSFGVGLMLTLGRDTPLVLDIDDWELGLVYGDDPAVLTHLKWVHRMLDVNTPNYTWFLERLAFLADERTVVTRFLQRKFGGTIVRHARDTDTFDPARFNKGEIRDSFGLPHDKTLVMFIGTPRPHKGVADFVEAVRRLGRDDVLGVVVGASHVGYAKSVREMAGDDVLIRGPQPFDRIPEWSAAADVIAIPQRRTPATRGQLPAKLIEAMAMANPIVATDVSDLPEILEGCGLIVAPEAPGELAEAIEYLVDNPEKRAELGRAAREKCIQEYSYDAVAPVVDRIVTGVG